MTQHGGFRLNATHTPAKNGQAIDHGGVRVSADQCVGIGVGDSLALHLVGAGPHGLGQVFEIHLMADAGTRRHDAEIVECTLPPFQKRITLTIAVILEVDVLLEGLGIGEVIDHHRMINDQIDRRQRVDLLGVLSQRLHGIAHGGQVDDGRNAGEILHQHAGRAEGDFLFRLAAVLQPVGDSLDVSLGHRAAILIAQKVLQQDFQRIGQLRDAGEAILLGRFQTEIDVGLGTHFERFPGLEAVERHRGLLMVGDCGWL